MADLEKLLCTDSRVETAKKINAAIENIDSIEEQLMWKVDVDATNLNTDGKSLIAGMAMPSNKYIDLTLGATGTEYIAPANGWFVLDRKANNDAQYLSLLNISMWLRSSLRSSATQYDGYSIYIPCKKGDVVSASYTFGGATNYFRFIYAQGSESEE